MSFEDYLNEVQPELVEQFYADCEAEECASSILANPFIAYGTIAIITVIAYWLVFVVGI